MIKRVIGIAFTITVFVVIIAAAINWGGYRSMLFGRSVEPEPIVVVERVDSIEPKSDTVSVKQHKPKKKLTPEQIEARKRAIAAKKKAAAEKEAEKKTSEPVE